MRQRLPIESGGNMNRNDPDDGAILITIPSYSDPNAGFALPVDEAPPRLLDALKRRGSTSTAAVGVGDEADEEHLLGRFEFSFEPMESVSLSDLQLVAEGERSRS